MNAGTMSPVEKPKSSCTKNTKEGTKNTKESGGMKALVGVETG